MGVNWTKEQMQAIKEKGSNILVAAAAGSGKTAVLVERMIQKIMTEEIDIDKILVVTFTNAAASEMRGRILDAIYKKLEEEPENKHLQKQLMLLPKSNICTIHSFCLEVIRNNFYEIDISPNFKIGDTAELEILKQEVLEELFEEKYEKSDKDFLNLIDIYTGYRGDEPLKEIVLNLYSFIQSSPFPINWIQEKVEMFNLKEETDFSSTVWGQILINEIKEEVDLLIKELRQLRENLNKYQELEKFSKVLSIDIQELEDVYNLEKWDELYSTINGIVFERWPQDKKVTNLLKEEAKEKRNDIKKRFSKIQDKIMLCDSKQAIKDINEMHIVLEKLKNIVLEFMDKFEQAKKERNIIDFNDIEHFALQILSNEEITKKYKNKFVEIAVDEYQDSNLVQEYILNSISNGKNLFMVGDVKQSIYKFRQARPDLFLSKYNTYKLKEAKELDEDLKIKLFKNFRSRKNVLDITNIIFENIMSEKAGEIDYTEEEFLNLGADYPEKEIKTELNIINLKENDDGEEIIPSLQEYEDVGEDATVHTQQSEEIIENTVLEAKFVAKKIQELIKEKIQVYDSKKQEYRNIQYKDIVVLLRSTNIAAPIYEKEISRTRYACF